MKLPVIVLMASCFNICNCQLSKDIDKVSESKLKCTAKGDHRGKMQWSFNGNTIKNDSTKYDIFDEIRSPGFAAKTESILHINHLQVGDEGRYQCHLENESTSNFTHFVTPSGSKDKIQLVVRDGETIFVNCTELGKETVSRKCSVPRLYNNDGIVGNIDVSGDPHLPFFKIVLNETEHQYYCQIDFHDNSNLCRSKDSIHGPIYNIIYIPHVLIEGTTGTVPEETPVSLTCSYADKNPSADANYSFQWNAMFTESKLPFQIDAAVNGTQLHFTPPSNVVVNCTVKGNFNGTLVETTASIEVVVIPMLSMENVKLTSKDCGENLTVNPNFSFSALGHKFPVNNDTTIYIGTATEVVLVPMVNGIQGHEYIVSNISKCDNSSVTLNFSNCESQTNEEISDKVSSLLKDVADMCQEQVCPVVSQQDWSISSCTVTFNRVPTVFISAVRSICTNDSDKCHIHPTPSSSTTSSSVTPTMEMPTETSTSDPPMAIWMIICLSSIAVLVLLVAVLLFCVICKCVKHKRERENSTQCDPESGVATLRVTPQEGSVRSSRSISPSYNHKTPSQSHDNHSEMTKTETRSQLSNFSDNISETTRAESRSQVSNFSDLSTHSSISTSTRPSQCSHCSSVLTKNSTALSTRSFRAQLPPSSLSNTSYKRDPSLGVTLNLTINDNASAGGEVSIALPIISMLNELGALGSEGQTQKSGDTGFMSETTRNISHESSSQLRSVKSSGYGGSRMPQLTDNDPNILNPFGKSGYSDSSSDGSTSSAISRFSLNSHASRQSHELVTMQPHRHIQTGRNEYTGSCSRV